MNERPTSMSWWSSGSSWMNILLGIWVIISPFVFAVHSLKAVWSNIVAGAIVGVLAFVRWSMHQPGLSWLNLFLGNMACNFAICVFARRRRDVE